MLDDANWRGLTLRCIDEVSTHFLTPWYLKISQTNSLRDSATQQLKPVLILLTRGL
jgi:hypothetical protein